MLTPEQVLPFLNHDDRIVRGRALRYFKGGHDIGPLTAEHFWEVIDRFGVGKETLRFFAELAEVPQTERSYQRLMQALRSGQEELYDFHLQHAAAKLDFPLVVEHRDELLSCDKLLPHVRSALELRLSLSDQPADALWDRLMARGRSLGTAYATSFNSSESEALIEALGRGGDDGRVGERAMAVLDDPAAGEDWREIFAVQVLGETRYGPAVDALVAKFAVDADVLRERVQDALTRIGAPEVVRKIEAFYPGKEWHVRLYADEPLSRIKRPESEAALLRLLDIETDEELRGNLLIGLTELGSMRGLEQSREWIAEVPDDPESIYLCECLLAVAVMTGTDLPEQAEWRQALAERDAESADRIEEFDEFFSLFRENWRKTGISDPPRPPAPRPGPLDPRNVPAPAVPARRTTPKVGRNDPCPCGSGKKYKKCCLAHEAG